MANEFVQNCLMPIKYDLLRHLPGARGQRYRKKAKRLRISAEFDDAIRRTAGMTCVDLGANVGKYTRRMAAWAGHVVAFEPDPWALDALEASLGCGLNYLHWRVP